MKNCFFKLPALLLLILVSLSFNSFAATILATQSGAWNASATWGGTLPTSLDNVIIQGNISITVTSTTACKSVQLGGSVKNTGTGTLVFNSGATLTVSGPVSLGPVNDNSTTGSLDMAAGGTLVCESIAVGKLGAWNAGTGSIELTVTNAIPSDNNVNFNNLTIDAGTTNMSRNLTVASNLTIKTTATFVSGANTIFVGGNYINNGVFNGAGGVITFNKNGNQTITGTGTNNFNLMRVDMGVSIANTLEVLSTHFTAPNDFLNIVNGTFKMSGNFIFSNSFFAGPAYSIDPTAGLWLNNPNVTVTGQAGNVAVKGLLRITSGSMFVGTDIDNSLNYTTGSNINIEGGTLHIAGRLTRNNATQITNYQQSGGIVTVVEQGSTDPVFAGFDLGAVGSSFTMSGGTITIRNATSAPADYFNNASVTNVTGGTLRAGDAQSKSAQTIRINTSKQIGNLLISNATAQAVKPVVQLVGSSLDVVNDITITPGTTLNAGGFNITLGGNWFDNGSFLNSVAVTFNGNTDETIIANAGENFNALVVNKASGELQLNNSVTVAVSLNAVQGIINVDTSSLILNGTVDGPGTIKSSNTGTVNYNLNSDGQNILVGAYGNLVFSNFNKTIAPGSIISVSNVFNAGTATGHVADQTTIIFNGATQPVPAFNYFNVKTTGTGTKTASAPLIEIAGNFVNDTSILFNAQALHLNGLLNQNYGKVLLASVTVNAPGKFENHDTLSVTGDVTGTGTIEQFPNTYFSIGGNATIAFLTAIASGNIVEYNGASQTVKGVNYYHLKLSGSGAVTLTNVNSILGNFTMSGTVHATAANAMSIAGTMKLNPGTVFHSGVFAINIGH